MKKNFLVSLLFVLSLTASKAQSFQFQTIGTTGISSGTPSDGTILNGKIYVSGTYYYVDGQQVNNFAVIDGNIYSESGNVPGSKTYGYGYSVATNTVYVLTADSPNYIYAETQIGEWDSVLITFDDQPKYIFAINDSEFVITGDFTVVNGTTCTNVCLWNAVSNIVTNIGSLGEGEGVITDMCMYEGKLLVPYYMSSASDPHFKVLDLTTMSLDYDPGLEVPNQRLCNFFADSDILYMSYLGIEGNYHVAKYENDVWLEIGQLSPFGADGMTIDADGSLVVCGIFGDANGVSITHGMARYDGSAWHDFSGIIDIDVTPQKVLMHEGTLYAIGNIWHNGYKVGVMRWVDPTGTPLLESNTSLSLYPNPTACILSVSCSVGKLITIRDLSGKTIKTFHTASNQLAIDLSELSPGMYILEIGNQAIKQKFVVAH
ncbi:MAG TPA: T9SS type A sorting domain-containing protein [Chitinophagales bacterium]|nr:T9SS type A sorting domain-containing protein [Chitinophagales bacterium]